MADLGLSGISPDGQPHGNRTLILNHKLCTLQTCDLSLSSFNYRPTLPGNAVFAALFAIFLVRQLYLGIAHKTWGYMVAMLLGLICEILGYLARLGLHFLPFKRMYFIIYLTTLTIGPAFLSAAIYLCLSRIVVLYGSHISRFSPRTYTLFFTSSDLLSLILQGAGGGIASTANTATTINIGKDIMLAGLGFQVVSLILFTICGADFAIRTWKRQSTWSRRHLHVVNSPLFKYFLVGLAIATVTIFARSTFRCIELSGGFRGKLFRGDEVVFIIMEGVMISIACFCLTVFHPAVCFQGVWHEAVFHFRKGKPSPGKELDNLLYQESDPQQNTPWQEVRQTE